MFLDVQQPTMFEGITSFPDVIFSNLPTPPPAPKAIGPQTISLNGLGLGTQGPEISSFPTIVPTLAELPCPVDQLFPIFLFMTVTSTGVQQIQWQCANNSAHGGVLPLA